MKARKAFVSLILAFLILSLIQSFLPMTPKIETVKADSAPWHLEHYQYRKRCVIEGSPSANVTNYIMGFKAVAGSGTDYVELIGTTYFGKFYVGSACRADFNDVRFVFGPTSQVMDYCKFYVNQSNYAYFFVKIPEINASTQYDIYVYYGFPEEIDESIDELDFFPKYGHGLNNYGSKGNLVQTNEYVGKSYSFGASMGKTVFWYASFTANSAPMKLKWFSGNGPYTCQWISPLFQVNGSGVHRIADIIQNGSEWEVTVQNGWHPGFHLYGDGKAPTRDTTGGYYYIYIENKDLQVGQSGSGLAVYIQYWTVVMGYRIVVDPEPSFVSWGNAETKPISIPTTWLTGYRYRKAVLVSGVEGAGVGYQLKFRVWRLSGEDSGNEAYLGTKCLPDFGDIRFADAQGNVFPYWIEAQTTDYIDVWINPNTIDLNNNQYIFVYYGNLTAEAGISASNLDATFIFAEDLSNSTLNLNKWEWTTSEKAYTISTSNHYIKFTGFTGSAQVKSKNPIVFPNNYIVEACFGAGGTEIMLTSYSFGNAGYYTDLKFKIEPSIAFIENYSFQGTNTRKFKAGVGGNTDASVDISSYTTYAKIIRRPTNYIEIYQEGTLRVNETNTGTPTNVYIYAYLYHENQYAILGNFKIRKYVEPEPQPTTWYAEEENPTASLTVTVHPSTLESLYVPFKLDGTVYTAPQTLSIEMGQHTLEVVQQVVAINSTHQSNFTAWYVNGTQYSTELNITINVSGDTTATMHYVISEVSSGVETPPSEGGEETPPSSDEGEEPSSLPPTYPSGGYAPVHFEAFNVELGIVKAGSTVNFDIDFSFDQVQIRIDRVEFQQQGEWFTLDTLLPKTFSRGTDIIGIGKIQTVFHAPQNTEGTFMIPYTIYASTSDGRQISAQASISAVISKSQGAGVDSGISTQPILGNPLALALLGGCVCWFGYYAVKAKGR